MASFTLFTPVTLDPADFSRTGLSIAQGHGYPDTNRAPGGGPSAFRPPGYPVFLAAIYAVAGQEAPPAARVVESLLGALSVALIGLIATRIWGRRIGVMALGIAAVAPPLVVLSTALVSESLFVPLILAAVAAGLEARRSPHPLRWAIFTGVLIGLAELTRTNALLLLPPLAYALWATARPRFGRALLRPALVIAATVLTVAPWTVRNWFVLHHFVPVSSEVGYTLAGTYNLASRQDHHWPAVWKEAEHGASVEYSPILFNASIHRWNEVTLDNNLLSAAIADIRKDPSYMLTAAAWNAVRMFHLGELDFGVANLRDTGIPKIPAWMEVSGFYVLGLLALIGLATRRVRRAPLWLWLVPVLLASTLFVTGFIRFRAGLDPFLVLLAALGVVHLLDRRSARTERRSAAGTTPPVGPQGDRHPSPVAASDDASGARSLSSRSCRRHEDQVPPTAKPQPNMLSSGPKANG
ncbi:MAG: glycosyltransferase family 39 protein [Actinomycetota bacterium]|nr:glycosyltransferase family 39 protein [Actinomycetota bacterium]